MAISQERRKELIIDGLSKSLVSATAQLIEHNERWTEDIDKSRILLRGKTPRQMMKQWQSEIDDIYDAIAWAHITL